MSNPYSDWVFTTKESASDEVIALQELCNYMVLGLEEGDAGYLHLQGFLQLKGRKRLETLKGLARTTHFEPRKGTVEEAIAYCKKDGIWFDFGEPVSQGSRTDIRAFVEDSKQLDARTMYERHPNCMVRYPRAFDHIRNVFNEDNERPAAKLYWLFGPARTGKTGWVLQNYPRVYVKSPTDWWWDSYTGQEAILIDEVTSGVPYSTVLGLCNPGQVLLPTKGSFATSKARRVFIASNDPPDRVYATESARTDRWNALLERGEFARVERTDVIGRSVMIEVKWVNDKWEETGKRKEFDVYQYERETFSLFE